MLLLLPKALNQQKPDAGLMGYADGYHPASADSSAAAAKPFLSRDACLRTDDARSELPGRVELDFGPIGG